MRINAIDATGPPGISPAAFLLLVVLPCALDLQDEITHADEAGVA
jgi:hypothetical protein